MVSAQLFAGTSWPPAWHAGDGVHRSGHAGAVKRSFITSIKIVVPEGIGVDLTGVSVMGEKSPRAHDVPTLTQSPTILVQGFPIMGEGKVKSRAPKNGPTT